MNKRFDVPVGIEPGWKLLRTVPAAPVNLKRYIMQVDMPEQKDLRLT